MFELNPRDIRPQDVERADEQAERVQALLAEQDERLAEIVGTGRGKGGHVHAAVAADGRVLKVAIEPRAVREGSQALSDEIILTVRRAQQDALQQVDALIRESLEQALPGTSLDPAELRERLSHLLD
jgi:DNA-binding protein YbaB